MLLKRVGLSKQMQTVRSHSRDALFQIGQRSVRVSYILSKRIDAIIPIPVARVFGSRSRSESAIASVAALSDARQFAAHHARG